MGTVAGIKSCLWLLRNQVAIVTGGGTGIGKAIASELLHLECNKVITSHNFDRLKLPAEGLNAESLPAIPAIVTAIQCNIQKEVELHLKEAYQNTKGKKYVERSFFRFISFCKEGISSCYSVLLPNSDDYFHWLYSWNLQLH